MSNEKILNNKRIVFIVAPEGFRDEELFEPKMLFEQNGAKPLVATKELKTAYGKLGSSVKIDLDYREILADDFDAIIFVGGLGAKVYFNDLSAHQIIKDAFNAKIIIGAICIAPWILASAGILQKKLVTSFIDAKEIIVQKGGIFTGEEVTIDDNIITANGPEAARKFGEAIMEKLLNQKNLVNS